MSGRVVGRVHERILGSAARKAVLLCLADHANPDGEMSYPSVRRIAQETELGESTVRECLAWLRQEKLVTQTAAARWQTPATYRVNLDALSDLQLVEVYRKDLQRVEGSPPVGGGDLQHVEGSPPAGGPEPSLNRPHEPSEEPETSPEREFPNSSDVMANDEWRRAVSQLQVELSKTAFETWLRDARFVEFADDVFTIGVLNGYARDWLADRLASRAKQILTGIVGRPVDVRFVVGNVAEAEVVR